LLKELNEESGVTIISATHDLKMIDVSDRIVHIRDGQIERIEDRSELELDLGSLEELTEKTGSSQSGEPEESEEDE
ncbi:MAG: hypothetical protein ACE5O2_11315, partial [Armatimonadota bacterium]